MRNDTRKWADNVMPKKMAGTHLINEEIAGGQGFLDLETQSKNAITALRNNLSDQLKTFLVQAREVADELRSEASQELQDTRKLNAIADAEFNTVPPRGKLTASNTDTASQVADSYNAHQRWMLEYAENLHHIKAEMAGFLDAGCEKIARIEALLNTPESTRFTAMRTVKFPDYARYPEVNVPYVNSDNRLVTHQYVSHQKGNVLQQLKIWSKGFQLEGEAQKQFQTLADKLENGYKPSEKATSFFKSNLF